MDDFRQNQVLRVEQNKLQSYKSSFQAWKCVSFGYALLAIVLLLSKWHEVSTDLNLLQSIDRLIWSTSGGNNLTTTSSILSPAAIQYQLTSGSANSTTSGEQVARLIINSTMMMDSLMMMNNETFLDSSSPSLIDTDTSGAAPNSSLSSAAHQHLNLLAGRELTGSQLLRQEVEVFLGEFRSAKSTLGLSSLLVIVYIISWILMTLAVNDTRISNDVSLRNILLLSVFGAIDMAASLGFVMVRLIMFNVKNNGFVGEMLAIKSFSDTPIRLSADQLTAFAALRLISMRSCSAYVDVYVSVIVALLTLLRVYAIVRAIAYYRFLRRFNDANRQFYQQHQTLAIAHSFNQHRMFGASDELAKQRYSLRGDPSGGHTMSGDESGGPHHQGGTPSMNPKAIWHPAQQHFSGGGVYQPTVSHHPTIGYTAQMSPYAAHAAHAAQNSARATPQFEPIMVTPPEIRRHFQQPASFVDLHHSSKPPPSASTSGAHAHAAGHLSSTNQHHLSSSLLIPTTTSNNIARASPTPTRGHRHATSGSLAKRPRQQQQVTPTPNLLLVNGRTHRLVSSSVNTSSPARAMTQHRPEVAEQSAGELSSSSSSSSSESCGSSHAGGVSEPEVAANQQVVRPPSRRKRRYSTTLSNQNLLDSLSSTAAAPTTSKSTSGQETHHPRKSAASFTLLSASKLDKLSRKLMARATGTGSSTSATRGVAVGSLGKYKVIARYRPIRSSSLLAPTAGAAPGATLTRRNRKSSQVDQQQQQMTIRSRRGGESTSNSSSDNEEEAENVEQAKQQVNVVETEAEQRPRRGRRRVSSTAAVAQQASGTGGKSRTSRKLNELPRQMEEFNVRLPTTSTGGGSGNLLMEKYYYA